MKKICVYTCITGDYDQVNEIEKKENEIDYYLFTNNKKITSKTWKVIYIENDPQLNDQQLSRKIKILGHEIINNYDIALWHDASVYFKRSIKKFIEKYYNEEIAHFSCFKHSERNCIYKEAELCLQKRKDTKENIIRALNFLKDEGYPKNFGLCEMTVFIKNPKNQVVQNTMKLWFEMLCNYSKRDQLSFMYCVWKNNLKLNIIKESVWNNSWFKTTVHNYDKKLSSYRVYFNDQKSKKYNFDNDFQGRLKCNGNVYTIDLVVPCNTKKTVVELPRMPFIKLTNLKINKIKNIKIHYFNEISLDEEIIFYNENGAFEFYNPLKKGDKLMISMELEKLENYKLVDKISEYINITTTNNTKLQEENGKLNKIKVNLEIQNKKLAEDLNSIVSRKSWRFIEKLDKIRSKIKGRK